VRWKKRKKTKEGRGRKREWGGREFDLYVPSEGRGH
jgi:hypothetical protein